MWLRFDHLFQLLACKSVQQFLARQKSTFVFIRDLLGEIRLVNGCNLQQAVQAVAVASVATGNAALRTWFDISGLRRNRLAVSSRQAD
ncbi:hypothetical protein WJ41_21470 [Burkholderia ubonensis]|nr:hypothetical protein WJ41_21470 [Burkholderia ubonensis]KVU04474.1 hypothetical protein WK61_33535 [Burkholderia ubonensis]KVU14031.1 hypothetical protein WK62_31330 [Burkholderia ubonensis]